MKTNYTEEERDLIVASYEKSPCRETVEVLAKEFNRSIKSVIGKLSREGVYKRESYVSKTGEKAITKLELVAAIADTLAIAPEELDGLEKTPKGTLKLLLIKISS
tara:strand:- start:327 stop:641 length:315 start_codon:yes stop_codon:yes gene_type:complete